MDTRKRTQILYDDPNSVFKAGKKIYLHELKGATLKSGKQFPDDIKSDLESQDLMSSLIRDLSQIQNIIEYFYTAMYEEPMLINAFSLSSIRDANKILGYMDSTFKKLMKVKPETFNEDDIFSLVGFFTDLNNKIQQIANYDENVEEPFQEQFYNQSKFLVFMSKIGTMLNKLRIFIEYINVNGIYFTNLSQQNIPSLIPPRGEDIPPPPDYPPDEEADDEMEGAGRFKVLSKRIRKQQVQPFKRFI